MKVEKLRGTDKRMYSLIAPFAMDGKTIRKNDGYPFTTSDKHLWYVAVNGKKVVGFLSIKENSIVNDFSNGDLSVLKCLLSEVLTDLREKLSVLYFTAIESELKLLQELGFTVQSKSVNYIKMQYEYKEAI
jgi:hypothetical protein